MFLAAQALPPSALPGISPSRGEIRWSTCPASSQRRAGYGPTPSLAFSGECREPQISPLEGEMSRSDRGGYRRVLKHQALPEENTAWR